jgi:hypothetical protein
MVCGSVGGLQGGRYEAAGLAWWSCRVVQERREIGVGSSSDITMLIGHFLL